MSLPKWGGRRAQAWSRDVLARKGRVCTLRLPGCTDVATTGDHIIPRSVRPDLQFDPDNGRPSCLHCNSSRNDGRRDAATVVDARNFFESAQDHGRHPAQSPPQDPRKTGDSAVLVRFDSDRSGS